MIHIKASAMSLRQNSGMIHYQLQCRQGHGFDGWFNGSASFEMQASAGLLECPICGDVTVERALMAPAVARKGNAGRALARPDAAAPAEAAPAAAAPVPAADPPADPPALAGRLPDHLRATQQRLRAEVEKNCDYVGSPFADEARRIHRGESDRRGIYGEASPGEAEALAEDGIEIARIPWVPRADG